MTAVIATSDLVKQYPGVRAVDGIAFEVPEGLCFGLLGPNGAGKTTTLEMLEGITPPSSGEIRYRGQPLNDGYRSHIGIQFQETSLQDHQTGREALAMFGAFYPEMANIDELIELCQLGEFIDRDHRKLSGGQKQRLLLAIALVNDPDLVFLDEPTTGLDPQSRRHFWHLIDGIKQRGKTILLTTHYMEEAQQLCDEIAVIDHGQIIERGAPRALLNKHFAPALIRLPEKILDSAELPMAFEHQGRQVEIPTSDINATIDQLQQAEIPLDQLQVASPTLEDLFLKLTGHGLRG